MRDGKTPGGGTERRIFVGLIVVGALLVLAAVLSARAALQASDEFRLVAHTYEVIGQVSDTLRTVLDIETGTRGFVITGKEEFLEPYSRAVQEIQGRLALLRTLTADNPSQQERVARFESSVKVILDTKAERVRTRREKGFEAARDLVATGIGKRQMDQIREDVRGMAEEEKRLLALRISAYEATTRWTIALLSALTLVVLGSLGAGFVYLRRDLARRKADEARFRALFDGSPHAVILADREGAIRLANPGVSALFGYPVGELIGRPVEVLVPGALREKHAALRTEFFASPRVRPTGMGADFAALRRDGTEFTVEIGLSPVETPEGPMVLAAIQDVTERKLATDALRRARDDAEASNRELEAFSYSVSHDLRAPLRGIHGFSQAILDDNEGKLDAATVSNFGRVQAAARRMGQLVDDLLMLSRISRADLARKSVDLTAVARSVGQELQQREPARSVDFLVAEGVEGEGDSRLLRVVLENLLENAWKFTGRLPRASVEFGTAEVGGERACFVKDNGAGFEMEYAGKLFGVFQRLHAQAEFPGTGVGLATVARVVHRHGGRVWAEGSPGRGATFWFTLPAQAKGGGASGQQAADPARG